MLSLIYLGSYLVEHAIYGLITICILPLRCGINENSVQRESKLDQSQDETAIEEYSTNIQQKNINIRCSPLCQKCCYEAKIGAFSLRFSDHGKQRK